MTLRYTVDISTPKSLPKCSFVLRLEASGLTARSVALLSIVQAALEPVVGEQADDAAVAGHRNEHLTLLGVAVQTAAYR